MAPLAMEITPGFSPTHVPTTPGPAHQCLQHDAWTGKWAHTFQTKYVHDTTETYLPSCSPRGRTPTQWTSPSNLAPAGTPAKQAESLTWPPARLQDAMNLAPPPCPSPPARVRAKRSGPRPLQARLPARMLAERNAPPPLTARASPARLAP
eukprot:364871-Chlamydomonas_euryale.AAC.1